MNHHNHHHHDHDTESFDDRTLLWSVIVNSALSVFEFIAGVISGSTALMADALHNTNDAAALLIAYIARKISKKGADEKFTFGYGRAELIGAMIQLTALVLVGLYLVVEAVGRIFSPEPMLGMWIMSASLVALVVDLATVFLLWSMSKGSLNVRAAFLHNISDAGASIAVLGGGAAIYWLQWNWVDPLLTLGIAGYILFMSFNMLKRTSHILMNGAPPEVSVSNVRQEIENIDGIKSIDQFHIWELDEQHIAVNLKVIAQPSQLATHNKTLLDTIHQVIEEHCDLQHSTIQVENE